LLTEKKSSNYKKIMKSEREGGWLKMGERLKKLDKPFERLNKNPKNKLFYFTFYLH
jgi:hypothetical protein